MSLKSVEQWGQLRSISISYFYRLAIITILFPAPLIPSLTGNDSLLEIILAILSSFNSALNLYEKNIGQKRPLYMSKFRRGRYH